jgi:hypothetical protein
LKSFTRMDDINRYKKDIQWRLYRTSGRDSGIVRYAIGSDFIVIQFKGNTDPYVFNHSVGKNNIEEMKRLASEASGLATFINRNKNVKEGYVQNIPPGFFE